MQYPFRDSVLYSRGNSGFRTHLESFLQEKKTNQRHYSQENISILFYKTCLLTGSKRFYKNRLLTFNPPTSSQSSLDGMGLGDGC